jgi:malate dehydrogenase (oxaloacetate-decarboxylating)
VAKISVSFGGINLEDISAPLFEIERKLQERLDLPYSTMTSTARLS